MHPRHALPLAVLLLALPAAARAATFLDDFEGGVNAAGWRFSLGGDTLEPAGGNPGWWLHSPLLDTVDPAVYSAIDSGTPFTGNYHANQVSRISVDLQTLHVDFGDGGGFNVVLLLRNTHGTPDDITDDDFAYSIGAETPRVGQGWAHYSFDVPSQSADPVPAGWSGGSIDDCEHFRPGVTWSDLMQSVNRVEIHYLAPCFFAIFQQWEVGCDNVSIDYAGPTSVEPSSWAGLKSLYR